MADEDNHCNTESSSTPGRSQLPQRGVVDHGDVAGHRSLADLLGEAVCNKQLQRIQKIYQNN